MNIADAQREVRSTYLGGSVGQVVSGLIWLASAALATFASQRAGILTLVLGGMLIFPLTQLALRLLRRPASLPKGNPFQYLAMQTAFIVPLLMPVAGGAALYNLNWFYPAFLMIVGAHYLPFITLYGMWQFGVLAAVLLFAGLGLVWMGAPSFPLGGWVGGAALVLFGLWIGLTRKQD